MWYGHGILFFLVDRLDLHVQIFGEFLPWEFDQKLLGLGNRVDHWKDGRYFGLDDRSVLQHDLAKGPDIDMIPIFIGHVDLDHEGTWF
mgnify:CR=1 FL=1